MRGAPRRRNSRDRGRRDARPAARPEIIVRRPLRNGRLLAWLVLQQAEHCDLFLQDLMADCDSECEMSSAERALAVDLSYGVMKRRRTLDHLIASRLQRPRSQTEPELWQILRLGTLQLLVGRVPAHAAVHTSVELCRELGQDRWTGFVNGILRNIHRLFSEEEATGPSSTTLPISAGRWIRLNEPLLTDPLQNRAEWFGQCFSLPSFLAERWAARFSIDDLVRLGFAASDAPVSSLRVNLLRTTREEVLQLLQGASLKAEPGHLPCSIRLQRTIRPDQIPGFSEGLWSIQDEAAMSAAILLNPQPGERILDLCAAPGGKTAHLAELSGDQAEIFACDISERRLAMIGSTTGRLQLRSVSTQLISADGNDIPPGPFDAILIDVPCSNTGVLGRRPEARWRADEESLEELIRIQTRLLLQAVERVRPGGRIVYSTCSMEPEENEGVVRSVMSVLKDWSVSSPQQHLPGQPADGACQILLTRNS